MATPVGEPFFECAFGNREDSNNKHTSILAENTLKNNVILEL
jgi:hypothetical protein